MHYLCPKCSSMKKPKIIRYFPPIAVKCQECGYINLESKFIKEQKEQITPLHFIH